MWQHTPVIHLGGCRQQDQEFKVILGYIFSLSLACVHEILLTKLSKKERSGEMAQQLRADVALAKDPRFVLSTQSCLQLQLQEIGYMWSL